MESGCVPKTCSDYTSDGQTDCETMTCTWDGSACTYPACGQLNELMCGTIGSCNWNGSTCEDTGGGGDDMPICFAYTLAGTPEEQEANCLAGVNENAMTCDWISQDTGGVLGMILYGLMEGPDGNPDAINSVPLCGDCGLYNLINQAGGFDMFPEGTYQTSCEDNPACTFIDGSCVGEICTDGIDNDGNGDIDCDDSACSGSQFCQCNPENYDICNECTNLFTESFDWGIEGERGWSHDGDDGFYMCGYEYENEAGTEGVVVYIMSADWDVYTQQADWDESYGSDGALYAMSTPVFNDLPETFYSCPNYTANGDSATTADDCKCYVMPDCESLGTEILCSEEAGCDWYEGVCEFDYHPVGDCDEVSFAAIESTYDFTDPFFTQATPSSSYEYLCDDEVDNDGDGNIDCDDSNCIADIFCADELCNNGIDDDLDGDLDCDDSECDGDVACLICSNGVIDNGENGTDNYGETCDDGNLINGDGCNLVCQTEIGYECTGEPSVCEPTTPCSYTDQTLCAWDATCAWNSGFSVCEENSNIITVNDSSTDDGGNFNDCTDGDPATLCSIKEALNIATDGTTINFSFASPTQIDLSTTGLSIYSSHNNLTINGTILGDGRPNVYFYMSDASTDAIRIYDASNIAIKNVGIYGNSSYQGDAIAIGGGTPSNILIENCFIGLAPNGTANEANHFSDIAVYEGGSQTTSIDNLHIINNKISSGIRGAVGVGANDYLIQGNTIGFDGSDNIINPEPYYFPIQLYADATNLQILGNTIGAGGIIIDSYDGVDCSSSDCTVRIEDNTLGIAPSGFYINAGSSLTIGNSSQILTTYDSSDYVHITNNIISDGVFVSEIGFTSGNPLLIQGNKIGNNGTTSFLSEDPSYNRGKPGIEINNASYVEIGGDLEIERNIISGNETGGITINRHCLGDDSCTSSDLNHHITIENNYVGTNLAGSSALANCNVNYNCAGMDIESGHNINIVNNLVSGNADYGILVDETSQVDEVEEENPLIEPYLITISDNKIGTDATGRNLLGNGSEGIRFRITDELNHEVSAIISNNIIAGSDMGVSLGDADELNSSFLDASHLVFDSNYIGTNSNGDNLGNGVMGMMTFDIGNFTFTNNVVANNGASAPTMGYGLILFGLQEDDTIISGNTFESNALTGFMVTPIPYMLSTEVINESDFTFTNNTLQDNGSIGGVFMHIMPSLFTGNIFEDNNNGDEQWVYGVYGAVEVFDEEGKTVTEGVESIQLQAANGTTFDYFDPIVNDIEFAYASEYSSHEEGSGCTEGGVFSECSDIGSEFFCAVKGECGWDNISGTCNGELEEVVSCSLFVDTMGFPETMCNSFIDVCTFTEPETMAGIWGYPNQMAQLFLGMSDESEFNFPFIYELWNHWPIIYSDGRDNNGDPINYNPYTVTVAMQDGRSGTGQYSWDNQVGDKLENDLLVPAIKTTAGGTVYHQVAEVHLATTSNGGPTPITYICPDPVAIDLDPEYDLTLTYNDLGETQVKVNWGEVRISDADDDTMIKFFYDYYRDHQDSKIGNSFIKDIFAYEQFYALLNHKDKRVRELVKDAFSEEINKNPSIRKIILAKNGIYDDREDFWVPILYRLFTENENIAKTTFKFLAELLSYHPKLKIGKYVEIQRPRTLAGEISDQAMVQSVEVDDRQRLERIEFNPDNFAKRLQADYKARGMIMCIDSIKKELSDSEIKSFNKEIQKTLNKNKEYWEEVKTTVEAIGKNNSFIPTLVTFIDKFNNMGANGMKMIIDDYILKDANIARLITLFKEEPFRDFKKILFKTSIVKQIENCASLVYSSDLQILRNEMTFDIILDHALKTKDTDYNIGKLINGTINNSKVIPHLDKNKIIDFIDKMRGLDDDFDAYIEDKLIDRRIQIEDDMVVSIKRDGKVLTGLLGCEKDETCKIDYLVKNDIPDITKDTTFKYQLVVSNKNTNCENNPAAGNVVEITIPGQVPLDTKVDADLAVHVYVTDKRDEDLLESLRIAINDINNSLGNGVEKEMTSCTYDYSAASDEEILFRKILQKNKRNDAWAILKEASEKRYIINSLYSSSEFKEVIQAHLDYSLTSIPEEIYNSCIFQEILSQEEGAILLTLEKRGIEEKVKTPKTLEKLMEELLNGDQGYKNYLLEKYNKRNTALGNLRNTLANLTPDEIEELAQNINTATSIAGITNAHKNWIISLQTESEALKELGGHSETLIFKVWDPNDRTNPIHEEEITTDIFGRYLVHLSQIKAKNYDFTLERRYVLRKGIVNYPIKAAKLIDGKYLVESDLDFTRGQDEPLTFSDFQDDDRITIEDIGAMLDVASKDYKDYSAGVETGNALPKIDDFFYIIKRLQHVDDPYLEQ